MATKAFASFDPRAEVRTVALRAGLLALAAATCVIAYEQVHAFFRGGLGLAGHLFPPPTAGFWRFAALFAVCLAVPTSIVEREALRRRFDGRRALVAALLAGALAWPAALVATAQVTYLSQALAGDPGAGYVKALARVSAALRGSPRELIGEALALAIPVVAVTLGRVHRLPWMPTFAAATATSALGAALALALVARQEVRTWLVRDATFWLAVFAGALAPLAYAAVDRLAPARRRVAPRARPDPASEAAEPSPPRS